MDAFYIGDSVHYCIPGQTWSDWWSIDGMYNNSISANAYMYNITGYSNWSDLGVEVTWGTYDVISMSYPKLSKTTIPGIFYHDQISR